MVVDPYRLETCRIIIHIQPSLITRLSHKEPADTLVLKKQRATVFAQTYFQPTFIHSGRQSAPTETVQCEFHQQMEIHVIKRDGACFRVIATGMQRAANSILLLRPTHIAIISLVTNARKWLIVRPVGHADILRLVPNRHATLKHAFDGQAVFFRQCAAHIRLLHLPEREFLHAFQ